MSVQEVLIRGRQFKIGKLDALKQFHVARRISPMLADMLPSMKELKNLGSKFEEMPEDEKLDHTAKVIAPFVEGLSKLSDKDSELVLFSLLSSVEVFQDQFKTWGKVANDKVIMMQDLDFPTLMLAAGHSFMANLQTFF